jgi:hypothetical protein
LLWKVSFLVLLEKLALPGRSFLGDRDFDEICIWAQMSREVTRGLRMSAGGRS